MKWSRLQRELERAGGSGLFARNRYDTEGWAGAAPQAAEITTFVNFSGFNTAGLSLSKAFGRDTNLQGQNGQMAASR